MRPPPQLFAAAAAAGVLLAAAVVSTQAPAPKPDLKPFAHWTFDAKAITGSKLAPAVGTLAGTVTGSPRRLESPTPSLQFIGPDDGVTVRKAVTPTDPFLPKRAFTAAAWVRVDEATEWGGILGCLQDNGPAEKGFVFGYNRTNFLFGLATVGADDGDGKITYLTGKTPYVPGRWYFVAATYDGKTMALSVNGAADGTSTEQSGDVLYAAKAPLTIGRYTDDDEDYAAAMTLKEVLWCDRAVPDAELAAYYTADKALADQVPAAPNLRFVIEPYLQYATRTGMTVMCETSAAAACVVQYGETFPPKLEKKAAAVGDLHEVRLEGLQAKTKYFYRVVCKGAAGDELASRTLTFMTAPDPGDAWSFCTIGDTQKNPKVTGKVAKLMWERRPHFVMHCGDVVDNGPDKKEWTDELFRPCLELFGRVPVFPTIGNHEQNHPHYYKYFSLPAPEYYYSFRYGNAEFFSLDTNKLRNLKADGEQAKWLDAALARSDAEWKVCFHHHPPYSSDEDDYGNTWKGPTTAGDVRVRNLVPIYEKHNVDFVFNGHVHVYERTWPLRAGKVDQAKGITYFTTGGGGGGLENFGPTPTDFKAEFRSDFHYCYITVHNRTWNHKAFDQEGRLFDAAQFKK